MNDQVKQAMLEATRDMPETYYWPGEYVEKFAKLIVRECATIYSKIDNGNAHLGTEDYLEALRKHFRS